MIESNAQFWCEFGVSFLVALGAWILGFWFFIQREVKPNVFPKTDFLPGKSEQEVNKFKIGFLQDLIKWAEILMEDLENARRVFERKALLMVSLSFAVIGYLFSDISTLDKSWGGWSVIVYSSFGIVAILGIKVVNFSNYWPRGQHPAAFRNVLARTIQTGKERKWVMYYVLDEYRKYIDQNREVINKKYKSLHVAKYFLIFGAGGLLSMALESSGQIAWICYRLACWVG